MTADASLDAPLIVGLGRTGAAVVGALLRRGSRPVVVEDRPDERSRNLAAELGVPLLEAPDRRGLDDAMTDTTVLLPSPGIPDRHPAFAAAAAAGVEVNSEFDLARRWDARPVAAITGTNGKTTVTMLTEAMVRAAGRDVLAAGNTDVPLVEAIDDPHLDCFVVEASSFRLGHTASWTPRAATWLNFAPDHLDVHADLATYEAAKARIWRDRTADQVAIGDLSDPVVARHAPDDVVALGVGAYRIDRGRLLVEDQPVADVAELWSPFPHDHLNALAAAANVSVLGADLEAVAEGLRRFDGLSHRVQFVVERQGVRWYDDSKATTPHATRAAVSGFASVVLIAGGRNKGVDLGALVTDRTALRAVIAIGEAADEIAEAFGSTNDVVVADSMAGAVDLARDRALAGDAVLLSPGCASFDWYSSYAERGDDFAALVRASSERSSIMTTTAHPPRAHRGSANSSGRLRARARHPTARSTSRRRPAGRRSPTFMVLLIVVTILTLLGLVMVLSASSVSDLRSTGNSWHSFQRQLTWAAIGVGAMFVTMRVDYQNWQRFTRPILAGCLGLLVLVMVPGVGVTVNGATRWLGVGPIQIQPAEFAKLGLLLWVCDLLARRWNQMQDGRVTLRPALLALGTTAVLLLAQPNLGTTIVISAAVLVVLLVAGTPLVKMVGLGVVATTAATGLALSAGYRRERVLAFLDPWADPLNTGYQTIQSMVGIASGGLTGVGLGASRAKWGFLPFAHTDFIFAIIAEELGLIGAGTVIVLFAALAVFGARAAMGAPDPFGLLLATGVTTWLVVQAIVNLGAVLGVLPITGVPLPFVSFGGSSLVITLAATGMLLNIARQSEF